jgi:hypothetical protein
MPVIRTALIALAATMLAGTAQAQSKPAKSRKVPVATTVQRQDQSYLYLAPSSGPRGRYPDYVTLGTSSRDTPVANTLFDSFGANGLLR